MVAARHAGGQDLKDQNCPPKERTRKTRGLAGRVILRHSPAAELATESVREIKRLHTRGGLNIKIGRRTRPGSEIRHGWWTRVASAPFVTPTPEAEYAGHVQTA